MLISFTRASVQYVNYLFNKGVPPVTVAEWTLQGDNNLDYYDGMCDRYLANDTE